MQLRHEIVVPLPEPFHLSAKPFGTAGSFYRRGQLRRLAVTRAMRSSVALAEGGLPQASKMVGGISPKVSLLKGEGGEDPKSGRGHVTERGGATMLPYPDTVMI